MSIFNSINPNNRRNPYAPNNLLSKFDPKGSTRSALAAATGAAAAASAFSAPLGAFDSPAISPPASARHTTR
jgi:hypothetical protein